MSVVRCVKCGEPYPDQGMPHICAKCGGIFDYDGPFVFQPGEIEPELPGLWRYRHTFGLPANAPIITLGEGDTPLVWDNNSRDLGLKFESLNPSGSFKDRGSALLLSQMLARGVRSAVEDSSGNAGASFAAYAAKAGVSCQIFVPEAASGPKRQQIEMYGSDLVAVPGPRSKAAEAVLARVAQGVSYASHAFLPFGMAGIATIAYEIFQQLGGISPGAIIAPVGHGSLLLGIVRGFQALEMAGLINRVPYYVGVQTAACDPVVRAFHYGMEAMESTPELPTIAEGVRVRNPVRAGVLLDQILKEQGTFISILEADIKEAHQALCQRGYYVEPTSALVWAACQALRSRLQPPVIAVLSGNGLKYIPAR